MIELNIPRRDSLRLQHLVTDVSGVCQQPRRGHAESSRADISVMSQDSAAIETPLSVELVMHTITAELELLDNPLRIVAGLRK